MTDGALAPAAEQPMQRSLAANRLWLRVALVIAASTALLTYTSRQRIQTMNLLDGLGESANDVCLADGTSFGVWKSEFAGFGCNSVVSQEGQKWLRVAPQAAVHPDETHAALLVGPLHSSTFTFSCQVQNVKQLRTESSPNPWEVGWVAWGYRDPEHFYYFTLKPNGWELGKRDPAYRGGQRFLATGIEPVSALGAPHMVKIVQDGARMTVQVDNRELATFEDHERPYFGGHVGLYCEDSEVLFGNLTLSDQVADAG